MNNDELEEIISCCQYSLHHDEIAHDAKVYLSSRIPEEYQNKYQFGFFPPNDQIKYITSLIDKKILENNQLVYNKSILGGKSLTGHFNNHNLIMPFRNVHGKIISIVGRTLLNEEDRKTNNLQKYKYTYASNKELYVFGLDQAKEYILEKDYVIGVEGQFDCISCHANGIKNVIAFGGAQLSRYQLFQLHRYTNNIFLMYDKDEAGRKALAKAKKRYGSYANIRSLGIPDPFKDVDEYLRKTSEQEKIEFINWLNNLK